MNQLPLLALAHEHPTLQDGREMNPRFVLLGEIEHMPTHVVVIRLHDQKLFAGFHEDNFRPFDPEKD